MTPVDKEAIAKTAFATERSDKIVEVMATLTDEINCRGDTEKRSADTSHFVA